MRPWCRPRSAAPCPGMSYDQPPGEPATGHQEAGPQHDQQEDQVAGDLRPGQPAECAGPGELVAVPERGEEGQPADRQGSWVIGKKEAENSVIGSTTNRNK